MQLKRGSEFTYTTQHVFYPPLQAFILDALLNGHTGHMPKDYGGIDITRFHLQNIGVNET